MLAYVGPSLTGLEIGRLLVAQKKLSFANKIDNKEVYCAAPKTFLQCLWLLVVLNGRCGFVWKH